MPDPIANADLVTPTNQEPTAIVYVVADDDDESNYRILENGEARTMETGEVIALEFGFL